MADVSVVIATHNRVSQVKVALDSVLEQTERVREIIVVDDGSTDDTRTLLAGYGNRIRPIFQSQSGASAARNRGVAEARGEWIAFLDDDDVWLPAKIAQQMAVARQDPRFGLVYCSDYAVDDDLRILRTRAAAAENQGDVFERLLIRNFIFTSCVIARRDLVEEAGRFDPQLRFAQDWDLWLKIAAKRPAGCVFEPLVLYRQSPTGCLTKDMKGIEKVAEMQIIVDRGLGLRAVPDQIRRQARHHLEVQWAVVQLREGRNRLALPHSMRAVLSRPGSLEGYRLLIYSLLPRIVHEWRQHQ